ncbi:MAG: patatin-like phospholipase family protein [Myxococcales bacterium]|jgi:NTE family protein|nr:patatin-like phospholipase family protein [Myxococcales bacterium]HQY60775.1 patatin-like phospholipase family protein [Polyangiaceae bacterium]
MTSITSGGEPTPKRVGMIFSGGGARGAYEVGVLSYVFEELTRMRGGPPRVDVLSGTSVGAINACYLAAHLADPVLGLRRLVHLWSELEITRVLGFGLRQFAGLPSVVMGGGAGTGLFDVSPMADLVGREISWRAVARSLRKNKLRALTVSTTEVATGRTVIFVQTAPNVAMPDVVPPRTLFRQAHIGPVHALASAAIPLLFPPVRIDHDLYLDGGLRQNTPIAPALALGATHIFAIASSREVRGVVEPAKESARSPGAAFLLGKLLNAFLLDHVDVDIEMLNRVNHVVADGTKVYGPDFTRAMSVEAERRGARPYRHVTALTVRPSEDIGKLAAVHVRKGKFQGNPLLTKRLFSLLDIGGGDEADLASYLLFDGPFCRQLIEMGRADAQARRDELLEFFGRASDDGGGTHAPDGGGGDSGLWDRKSLGIPLGT